ncbi:MAG: hypothetical protein ACI87A_002328 [Planctomycetota bacterium]|jgi:hypothetical protein
MHYFFEGIELARISDERVDARRQAVDTVNEQPDVNAADR